MQSFSQYPQQANEVNLTYAPVSATEMHAALCGGKWEEGSRGKQRALTLAETGLYVNPAYQPGYTVPCQVLGN